MMKIPLRWRRAAAALAVAAAAATGATAAHATSAPAGVVHPNTTTWQIVNSPGTWRLSPSLADNSSTAIGNGQSVTLTCYYWGDAAGPYNNQLWYSAYDVSTGTRGWINDHYLNTPDTATNPIYEAPECTGAGIKVYSTSVKFQVVNTPSDFDNSPYGGDTLYNYSLNDGDTLNLYCYYIGAPSGQYGNTLWYLAYDTNPYYADSGWINDHYLNTPDTAAHPIYETPRCQNTTPTTVN